MTKTTPFCPPSPKIIAGRRANARKTQREFAEECAYEKTEVVTMLKSGTIELPLNPL